MGVPANNYSSEKNKLLRLIEYLRRINLLRFKLITDLDNYEKVFWLYEVPQTKECYSRLWKFEEKEYDPEVWIEIKLPSEPKIPPVPEECKEWIDERTLKNKNNPPLLLKERIKKVEKNGLVDYVVEKIDDFPEIKKIWEDYLENKWLLWVKKHDEWEKIAEPFKKLYEIHLEQLKQGEQYELILGLGLLTWKIPFEQATTSEQGQLTYRIIKHPIIVANAAIEYNSEANIITIKAHQDGPKCRIEKDIFYKIGNEQLFNVIKDAENHLSSLEDPFDFSVTEPILKSIVHSLDVRGEYLSTFKPSKDFSEKPEIRLVPVLILRKSPYRGFLKCLEEIKKQIEQQSIDKIPKNFLDLCEIITNTEDKIDKNNQNPDLNRTSVNYSEAELFFPKPSNKEQNRIVYELMKSDGIVVQGPPGTGKSHAISNLVCHLLATGHKILVTAQTSRALKVLERLIPQKFHPLCVFLLGVGIEEKKSLENSVRRLLTTWETYDYEKVEKEISKLKQKLEELKKEKAELENKLQESIESEFYSVEVNEKYKGTASQIAKQVNQDKKVYEWFKDSISPNIKCPFSEEELVNFLKNLRDFYKAQKELSNFQLDFKIFPDPEKFKTLVEKENLDNSYIEEYDKNFLAQLAILNIETEKVKLLQEKMENILIQLKELLKIPENWINQALSDAASENIEYWKKLLEYTKNLISEIDNENLVEIAGENVINYSKEITLKALYEDLLKLKEHLDKGGKLGWWIFRPKVVKETFYIFNEVKLNGKKISLSDIALLEKILKLNIYLENLWNYWINHIERTQGSYLFQINKFKTECIYLQQILSFYENLKDCKNIFINLGLKNSNWLDDKIIEKFINSCKIFLLDLEKKKAKKSLKELEKYLSINRSNSMIKELLEAVKTRNTIQYENIFKQIENLKQKLQKKEEIETFINKLKNYVPRFIKALCNSPEDPIWNERIKNFRNAWLWSQARFWIEEHIKKDETLLINTKIKQMEEEIFRLTEKIGSLKAWQFALTRLQEKHKRHMIAWQQAIKRLGKGTGKYAYRHRKDAQFHLEQCREAIPAWVMPLYRLWDTINPQPGMFDIIIIDEASQCGLNSLLLFYLGKKLIVVGDDKQITPEETGIEREQIFSAAKELLYDFNFKDSFYLEESSLFHHAQLRFKNLITLREHFRCMPEIIKFSNNLCYHDSPLIPLRQYGSDRLEPLMPVYVPNGYCEGTKNQIINKPEAEAVVQKIIELCNNPKYKEKTMGVISLLGEAQAKLIENMLLKELGVEEFEKRRFICGNPYHFQGDERDIIFLSLVIAPNHRYGVLTKASDIRRFNVAASRARDQIWLFYSVKIENLNPNCVRRKLLEHFLYYPEKQEFQNIFGMTIENLEKIARDANRSYLKPPSPFQSWFEVDVALELLRRGYKIMPQYEIAGRRIDIVVMGSKTRMAIECDGDYWHGPEKFEEDMQRQRQLERCGWEFFRIRESIFYANKENVIKQLCETLEKRGIYPMH